MPTQGTYVAGLRETVNALVAAGVELDDVKDVMARISDEAAETMRGFVPVRSGKLRASVRGSRTKNRAVVSIGRATVPYAAPINYGWRRRNIRPSDFIARTDAVMETKAVSLLEQGLDAITRKHGLQ